MQSSKCTVSAETRAYDVREDIGKAYRGLPVLELGKRFVSGFKAGLEI